MRIVKASYWSGRIVKQMKEVGTWRESFRPAVTALSDILERRDIAYQEFLDSGEGSCVEKISDRGAVNMAKNPRLQIWADLNALALSYWRDLGLTPAGLKKIDEAAMKPKKVSALAEALKDLG